MIARKHIGPIAAALAVALAVTASALAAQPKKGGRYDGYLYKGTTTGSQKHLRIIVAPTGKTGLLLWWCGTTENISARKQARFRVNPDGTFKAGDPLNNPTYTVWSASGRFVSASQARVQLRIPSWCDGKGGLATLALS